MQSDPVIDTALIRKYGGSRPRYPSYPPVERFADAFDATSYGFFLRNRTIGGLRKPISLYVHLPLPASVGRGPAAEYVRYLEREVKLLRGHLGGDRSVSTMHWDGGMPAVLSDGELTGLCDMLRSEFDLDPWGEHAIDADPRRGGTERIALLGALGFNHVSFPMQDIDSLAYRSHEHVRGLVRAARDHGFRLISAELTRGLPGQTAEGFLRALDITVENRLDRIALRSLGSLAAVPGPGRRPCEGRLPCAEERLEILVTAAATLLDAGYIYIGMDQFVRVGDDLAAAQREGRLVGGIQGYSSAGDCDIIGLGVSALGRLGQAYGQNDTDLAGYYTRLDAGELPVRRGMALTTDDLVRRAVIDSLACHFRVSKESISIGYLVDFDSYFAAESGALASMEQDGVVTLDDEWITVTARGRFVVQGVCRAFYRHLRADRARVRHPEMI